MDTKEVWKEGQIERGISFGLATGNACVSMKIKDWIMKALQDNV